MEKANLGRLPLYMQIKQKITERIGYGEWKEEEALPSEWALASEFAVSQGTVRKALTALVESGLLYRQQGRGTFVSPIPNDWGEGVLALPGWPNETPTYPKRELLGLSRFHADENMAAALELPRQALLWRIYVLWRLASEPVAVDEIFLPLCHFEDLDPVLLRKGIYETLQKQYGVRLKLNCEQFRALFLPRHVYTLLGGTHYHLREQNPVLSIVRLSVTEDGKPMEWRLRYCFTDKLAFTCCRK